MRKGVKMDLKGNDKRIYSLIGVGIEKAITARHIAQQTNLDKRTVRECVRRLIIKHKIPIIGNRKGNYKGYFIPANHSELMAGIGALEKQIEEEKKRLEVLLDTEL
ncbi:DNA-binding protein [Streptococcus suis]|uniref:DNA-binding protein n=1 Tax=Streptococcus suis TaxID=1307 RepID=UPI001ABE7E74|nr:DNA-binding protein [Streptococcus suis]